MLRYEYIGKLFLEEPTMKLKKLLALLLSAVMVLSLAACGGGNNPGGSSTPSDSSAPSNSDTPSDTSAPSSSGSGETISLTLWGGEEDQNLLAERVEAFKAAYPDQTFDIKIGVESESTAKDTILTDIEAAADVFAFADDQLADLVDAGALMSIGQHGPSHPGLRRQVRGRHQGCQRPRLRGGRYL